MIKLTNVDRELIMMKVNRNMYEDFDAERTMDIIETYWAKAKEHRLFEMFGDSLILKKHITVERSIQEIARSMSDECFHYLHSTLKHVARMFVKKEVITKEDLDFIVDLIASVVLAENRVPRNYVIDSSLTEKPMKFSKGQKVTKALAQIAQALKLDMVAFEEFRIRHSQVLNDKVVKGNLCLSIHPLDYMTMSDNANGWESCMSWDDSGCYRGGTLECMNCNGTIVAYLESNTKEYVVGEDGEGNKKVWNSKKWRQLVTITPELIMTNKGYPFRSDILSNEVLNWVAELAGEEYNGENIDYEDYKQNEVSGFSFIQVATELMYDDTENGSHSFVRLGNLKSDKPTLQLGGTAYCLACGDYLDTEEGLCCYDCQDKGRCYECGDTYNQEHIYSHNGENYCSHCYDHVFRSCECCGNNYFADDVEYLDEEDLEKYEGEHMSGCYCKSCIEGLSIKTDDTMNVKPVE